MKKMSKLLAMLLESCTAAQTAGLWNARVGDSR